MAWVRYQYLRARYYDPTTGEFVTSDPLRAATGSPYGYTNNNPLNGTDPNGLWEIPTWVPVVGGSDCFDNPLQDENSCESVAEQNPDAAQGTANAAGGLLDGVTLGQGRTILSGLGQSDKVEWASNATMLGRIGGIGIAVVAALGGTPALTQVITQASRVGIATGVYQACSGGFNGHCAAQGALGLATMGLSFLPIKATFGDAFEAWSSLTLNLASGFVTWFNDLFACGEVS